MTLLPGSDSHTKMIKNDGAGQYAITLYSSKYREDTETKMPDFKFIVMQGKK